MDRESATKRNLDMALCASMDLTPTTRRRTLEHKGKNPLTKTHLSFIIKNDALMVVKLVCVDRFKMCAVARLIVLG